MKHFGVAARARRHDPQSRHGGHQGHSLAQGFPEAGRRNVLGYHGVAVSVERPQVGDDRLGVSKLELECPSLLETHHLLPFTKGIQQVRDHSQLFELAEYLERTVEPKRRIKSRQCPGIVETKYLVPAVGLLSTKQKAIVDIDEEAPWGEVEFLINQKEGASNQRRVPVTCSWCRRGCKRCSKNKGRGGICKTVDLCAKTQRHQRRRELKEQVPEALTCLALEGLHYQGLTFDEYLATLASCDLVLEELQAGGDASTTARDETDIANAPSEGSESSFIMVDDDVRSCGSWSLV